MSASPDFNLERNLLEQGYKIIAGIDEAGRGSLAGPLSVGCVIYTPEFIINPPEPVFSLINDSKKLTEKKREAAFNYIIKNAAFAFARLVSHKTVDKLNVNGATQYSIERLLAEMDIKPDVLLIDGNFSFHFDIPSFNVKNGDSRSISIAAASIAAKVRRDEIMKRMDILYSGYGFAANMGYGTASHRDAIKIRGPSPIHRLTYEPLKGMLAYENPS